MPKAKKDPKVVFVTTAGVDEKGVVVAGRRVRITKNKPLETADPNVIAALDAARGVTRKAKSSGTSKPKSGKAKPTAQPTAPPSDENKENK